MTRPAANPNTMRTAAAQIDDASNAIHALQTLLTQRVNSLTAVWSADTTSDFMRAYLSFDRDISRIQTSLEDMHAALTASTRALAQAGTR